MLRFEGMREVERVVERGCDDGCDVVFDLSTARGEWMWGKEEAEYACPPFIGPLLWPVLVPSIERLPRGGWLTVSFVLLFNWVWWLEERGLGTDGDEDEDEETDRDADEAGEKTGIGGEGEP